MYSLVDELLCLSEKLRSKNTDRSSSIADFIILDLTDINEDLGSCVVQSYRFENCGAVIRDRDISTRCRLQNFILT